MNMNIFLGSYFHDFVAFTIVGHGGPWSHQNIDYENHLNSSSTFSTKS